MTAEEARKLTNQYLQTQGIESHVETLLSVIRNTAQKGRFSITHPFRFVNELVTQEKKEAIFSYLKQQGYKVIHHEDPDPSSSHTSPFDEISWG